MSPTLTEDDSTELQDAWFWYFLSGGLQILLGLIALSYSVLVAVVSVEIVGWLMVIGGALELGHSIWHRRWKGFFIDLLSGLLAMVVGLMVVAHPAMVAVTLTVVIAIFLVFGGVFRIALAFALLPSHWGWLLVSGIITFMLGIAILQKWPDDGLWVIGFFIGLHMILHGVSSVMLALSARRPPTRAVMTPP